MGNKKLNQAFITQYSSVFADQLIRQVFTNKDFLDGKDIMDLTPIRQLNLFILKSLFTTWQEEMKKLESPYFDYKNTEVRQMMVQFMNVLSQHIQVNAHTLKPLIEDALANTLLLAVSPHLYLQQEFDTKVQASLSQKAARQTVKYLALYKTEISSYVENNIGAPVAELFSESAAFFRQLICDETCEDLAEKLSHILTVSAGDFTIPAIISSNTPIAEKTNSPAFPPATGLPQAEDSEISSSSGEPAAFQVNTKETEQKPAKSKPAITTNFEEDEEEEEDILNNRFEPAGKSLANVHEEKGVDNILEAISINHRYMFLQELFDGEEDRFRKAMEKVDNCNSFDEAVEFLVQNYSKDYFWDMNSDEVKELLKVVFRRFRK